MAEERHERILAQLMRERRVLVGQLSSDFGVLQITIPKATRVFASYDGKPYHAAPIQQDYFRQAGRAVGLKGELGWHTFRHSYRSMLDASGAPIGVQQKLMRHA